MCCWAASRTRSSKGETGLGQSAGIRRTTSMVVCCYNDSTNWNQIMSLSMRANLPPLRETEDGVVRIANTRIPLERVIESFLTGMTPEEIALSFDVLQLEDIYAVINYY